MMRKTITSDARISKREGRPAGKAGRGKEGPMKKDLGSAGELFPQSVFIVASYDEDGVPNAMNVAWGGECTRNEVAINIGDHKTTDNILATGAFTVAPADAAHVVEADYFGMATGHKVDKAKGSRLTFVRSDHVNAPVIDELPLTMECIVRLDDEGHVDFGKMKPIVYDSTRRIYRVVGDVVGGAWDVGKALL